MIEEMTMALPAIGLDGGRRVSYDPRLDGVAREAARTPCTATY